MNQHFKWSFSKPLPRLLITLLIMAMASPKLLFFFFFFLPLLSSGTLVGFSYHAKGNAATATLSFLELDKVYPLIRVYAVDGRVLTSLSNTGVSVDLYLSQAQAWSLTNSNSSATSWLETRIVNLSRVDIRRIVVSTTLQRQNHDLGMLLSALESIHSGLTGFRDVEVSAAFSVSSLKNLSITQGQDLQRICSFINKAGSSIILEDSIEGELAMGDRFALEMVKRAELAVSLLSDTDVQILVTISSSAIPRPTQVAELSNKVLKHVQNNSRIRGRVAGLYAEVAFTDDLAAQKLQWQNEQTLPSSHREVLEKTLLHTTSHDEINPPNTVFPTTPVSTTPITIPPDTPFVTVPATNPVTTAPTNPVPLPSTTPITVPPTDPVNSPMPVTNPVTTPPVTNPVTTYPAPAANVPVMNPVVAPPAMTDTPATPGESWCVAKAGAPESTVQAALDYACGIGGADCAQIQQSGSCYNPNSLQNHASYAFNSYYQKSPSPSSCDFGGAATITSTNPSTGSCIFPSSSSSSTSPQISTPTSPVTTPITTPTPTPTTSSSSGAGVAGPGVPPMVPNSIDPASGTPTVFGSEVPPGVNTSTMSISARLQPFWGCIVLVTSFVTQKIVL